MRGFCSMRLHPHFHMICVSRFLAVMIISALLVLSLTGCSGTQPQKDVPDTAITQTPENVARVFAEAVFRGDRPMMFKCYPAVYTDSLSDAAIAEFDTWGSDVQAQLQTNVTEYVGTSSSDSILYASDKTSALYQEALGSISMTFGISSEEVSEIRTCVVQVFFSIDSTDKYQNVQVLVYKMGINWFADDITDADSSDN